jgi:hypothetical protein
MAVLLLLHAGAAAQLYGLLGAAPADASRNLWLWIGLGGLYGSFVLGIALVAIPALPWIQRARRVARWREWLLTELPELLALIPIIIQTLRALRDAWEGFDAARPQGARAVTMSPSRKSGSRSRPRKRKVGA